MTYTILMWGLNNIVKHENGCYTKGKRDIVVIMFITVRKLKTVRLPIFYYRMTIKSD